MAETGKARTTTLTPWGCCLTVSTTISLSLLLTRLRVTAFPTVFATMNPIWLGSSGEVDTIYNTTFRRPLRTPERTVCEKLAEVRILFLVASTLRSTATSVRLDESSSSYCLGRQLYATLGAAGCQNGAASAGAHTKAEAVLLGTTAVVRLKSPLAHGSYSKTIKDAPCP